MKKLGIQQTSGGKDILFECIKSAEKKDWAMLSAVVNKLKKDGIKGLDNFNTRPISPPLVYEIRKGNWRVFYTIYNGIVVLLHCTYKQKNKTESHDKNKAISRAKKINKNGLVNIDLY